MRRRRTDSGVPSATVITAMMKLGGGEERSWGEVERGVVEVRYREMKGRRLKVMRGVAGDGLMV